MKYCITCHILIQSPKNNTKYCLDCSKLRRKEKYLEYNKNRKLSDVQLNRLKSTEVRRNLRQQYRKDGLCNICGKERFDTLLHCQFCHEINLKSSTKFNRSKGMLPSGQSSKELKVFDILQEITEETVIRNTYKIIRSPLTNSSLELDLYLPNLKFAIEVDGPMHRVACYGQDRLLAQQINDKIKEDLCLKKGIFLLRINTDLMTSEEYIRTTLSEAIQKAISLRDSSIERAETSS